MALLDHKGPLANWRQRELQVGSTVDVVKIGPSILGSIKRSKATEQSVRRQSIAAGLEYVPPKQQRSWDRGVFNNDGPGGTPPTAGRAGWYFWPILDNTNVDYMYRHLFDTAGGAYPLTLQDVFGYIDWCTGQTHYKNFKLHPANLDVWVCHLKQDIPVTDNGQYSIVANKAALFGPNPSVLLNNFTTAFTDFYGSLDPIEGSDYRNHPKENKVFTTLFHIGEHRRFRLQPGEEIKLSFGVNRMKVDPIRDDIKVFPDNTNALFSNRWIQRKWQGPCILTKIWGDPVIKKEDGKEPVWAEPNMGAAELSYIDTQTIQWTTGLHNHFNTNYEVNISLAQDPTSAANDIPTTEQITAAAIVPTTDIPFES